MNHNIVDMLCTFPTSVPFEERICRLHLDMELELKIISSYKSSKLHPDQDQIHLVLNKHEEEAIASEVLYNRYRFTLCLLNNRVFRQAALTIIQNIYLFRNRRIFFKPEENTERERQLALQFFSSDSQGHSLPITMALQHLILSRIWSRIINHEDTSLFQQSEFLELHSIVQTLNTLRNVYMLFSFRLLNRMAKHASPVYRQSITFEDAVQIGNFGVARAAYRYHPSYGVRFTTYAANWIKKELQKQALAGRLIRIPSHVVEQYSSLKKRGDGRVPKDKASVLSDAIPIDTENCITSPFNSSDSINSPNKMAEERQQQHMLRNLIERKLPKRSGDIIKRRYGLPPYNSVSQSAVEIAEVYGLTRGRVYQIEQDAFKVLRKYCKAW